MGSKENNIINIGEGRLPKEALESLQTLASTWPDVDDINDLQVVPLKGAMTNAVYQIKWHAKTKDVPRKVILRIYGEGVEFFFDRDDEMRTFEFMSKHGHGPFLLGQFEKGRIEEYINARTLSAFDLCDPDVSTRIAIKMKEFHDLDVPVLKRVFLWDRLRNWVNVAKGVCPMEEAKALHFDAIVVEISLLEKELSGEHQCIGFCHNDLQYGNIMMDDKTRAITIIDYEYASYNPIAYDIANHFCEWAADYHKEVPHKLDYNKYPSLEERQRFVYAYLNCSGNPPSELEVEQLIQEIEKYTLASHLFWGLWGIISEYVNDIDFDYLEYARQRVEQYWVRKASVLNSNDENPFLSCLLFLTACGKTKI